MINSSIRVMSTLPAMSMPVRWVAKGALGDHQLLNTSRNTMLRIKVLNKYKLMAIFKAVVAGNGARGTSVS